MEILRHTNIQFMKYRKYWVLVSLAFLTAAVIILFVQDRLNLGIDFAGGTQLTLKFADQPEVEELRRLVEAAGVDDAVIQSFGSVGDNEILIKAPVTEGSEEGSRELIVQALEEAFAADGRPDANQTGRLGFLELLDRHDPDGLLDPASVAEGEPYGAAVDAILAHRRAQGLIVDWSELAGLNGVSEQTASVLSEAMRLGEFTVLGAENVGPQVGSELRQKGIYAIVLSLLGMLAYIWFRFELRFGIGALVAVVHDVLITLGLYALAGFEFNLTTVAAFLTLVGYSVNDSVVVFDRVRENLRRSRSSSLEETMNLSLNQTLSRTVLTSGTTLIVVGCLLFLGGDVLRGFAFILTIGVIVGTYSSMYVASPFALLWEKYFGRAAKTRRRESRAAAS